VHVPDFANIEEAEAFQLHLSKLEANREIDSRTARTITERIQNWISNKRADEELEIKRLASGDIAGDQLIRIEGGLPELPGTSIDMPHKLNGHTIESLPGAANAADGAIESTPVRPSASPEVDAAPASAEVGAAQPIGKP
jgi:hypothetical protein